jgi:hypothetical protein
VTLMLSLTAKRVSAVRIGSVAFSQRGKAFPAYEGHVPLNWAENAFMAVGSALAALADPRRGGKFSFSFFFISQMLIFKQQIW